MNLEEKQQELIDNLENLRNNRVKLDQQIRQSSKDLEDFLQIHGDVIAINKRNKEWGEQQEKNEEIRKTVEWQNWRRKFLGVE